MCFLHVKVAKRDTQRAEGKAGVLMLGGQKQDKDKTPVMSTILNHFDFGRKTHCFSGDCSTS